MPDLISFAGVNRNAHVVQVSELLILWTAVDSSIAVGSSALFMLGILGMHHSTTQPMGDNRWRVNKLLCMKKRICIMHNIHYSLFADHIILVCYYYCVFIDKLIEPHKLCDRTLISVSAECQQCPVKHVPRDGGPRGSSPRQQY